MKAVVYDHCGSADVLRCEVIETPLPADSQVLIRVRAAGVNPLDVGELKGLPYLARLIFGLRKPDKERPSRPGVDLAGEVEAVGSKVTRFKPGDAVWGFCVTDPHASGVKVWVHDQGAFAEYVCAPEATLAIKPENVTFEQAASAGVAGVTALQGLRDVGHIRSGQNVLVNGAAGGVGTFAVQIAKSFGAEVTAVCSTRNAAMVKSIGADQVVDYTQQDFTRLGKQYDLIFDCVANHSLSECRRVLAPNGICVMAGDVTGRGAGGMIGRLLQAVAFSKLSSQKFVTFLAKPKQEDLAALHDLMEAGKIEPVLDKRYSLSQVPEAIRYLEQKHAGGKVVISVA